MAGIVGARGKFIRQNGAVLENEKLHAENADVLEFIGNLTRKLLRSLGKFCVDAGRHHGVGKDAVPVMVFADGEDDGVALRIAADDDRNFRLQIEALFEHAVRTAEFFPGGKRFLAGADARLALAVIAETSSLQNAGEKRIFKRLNVLKAANRLVGSCRNSGAFDEGLFDVSILRGRNGVGMGGRDDAGFSKAPEACRRDILKFRRNGENTACKLVEAFFGAVALGNLSRGDFARGRRRMGFEHHDVVAHAGSRLREHPAELAASEEAELSARKKCADLSHRKGPQSSVSRGSVIARALAFWAMRKSARRRESSGSLSARI